MKTEPAQISVADQISKLREKPRLSAEEVKKWEFIQVISPRLAACGWEKRFHHRVAFGTTQKLVHRDTVNLLKNKGAIIALVGERGLGKTTIAAHIAIDRAEHFWDYYSTQPEDRAGMAGPQGIPCYRKMAQLVSKFKPLYADFGSIDSEKLMEVKDRLCNETLLVIDELHECEELRMKDRILTDIVDIRYARLRDTILISNQTADDFKASTNDSVISRLTEHGKIIGCKWKSYRGRE